MLREFQEEIARLKAELSARQAGNSLPPSGPAPAEVGGWAGGLV